MRIIFLPETEDEPWNMRVTVGTPQSAVLGTYGDTDQFTVEVQPGKRYVVRVLGRETGDGTASTPWMQFAYRPLADGRYCLAQHGATVGQRPHQAGGSACHLYSGRQL